jgi:hypothetical protein
VATSQAAVTTTDLWKDFARNHWPNNCPRAELPQRLQSLPQLAVMAANRVASPTLIRSTSLAFCLLVLVLTTVVIRFAFGRSAWRIFRQGIASTTSTPLEESTPRSFGAVSKNEFGENECLLSSPSSGQAPARSKIYRSHFEYGTIGTDK